jgi:acetyltransferase-like isoleucine patch superfamily enzyme
VLHPSERAPGLFVGDGVELPDDVWIGAHVVIHDGTSIGAGVRIQDGAVLGKPVALGPRSTASREPPPPLAIGAGATVCAGAVVLAGARLGAGCVVGDRAHVRERAVVGEESVVGAGVSVDNDVTIGARVRVQTGAYITAHSVIEDDVFVAPCVTTTNDNTMGRHGVDFERRGALLRRACRVGAAALLLPGIEIGEEAFVAAGSVVTRDVPPRTLVMGSPARQVRQVADEELLERWR